MAAVLVNVKGKEKAMGMAPATNTEAPGIQARVAMAVVMNHVRVVELVVDEDVDAATNGLRS